MIRFAAIGIALALVAGCDDPAAEGGSPSASGGPAVACVGVPLFNCDEAVRGVRSNGFAIPPVSIRVRCTTSQCTDQEGEALVDVVYADGSRSSSGIGWGTAGQPVGVAGPPALTVVPTCIRIDRKQCQSAAENAQGGRPFPPPIRSIVVTCTGACGPLKGTGTTVITYADGTTDNGSFIYEGG